LEELVYGINEWRAENDSLRAEVHEAVVLLERWGAALPGARAARSDDRAVRPVSESRARRVTANHPVANSAAPARGRSTPHRTTKARKGRSTPEGVTPGVVLSAIGKLGGGSAKTIAAELSRAAGLPVSGRAVRFLAEKGGAKVSLVNGERRYSLV